MSYLKCYLLSKYSGRILKRLLTGKLVKLSYKTGKKKSMNSMKA